MRRSVFQTLLVLCLFTTTVTAEQASVSVSDAWVREAPPTARVMAGYMILHNSANNTQSLVQVNSPQFDHVEIHDIVMQEGVARMVKQERLVIPAAGSVELKPGSYHLMLMQPQRPLKAGDSVELILGFDQGKALTVQVPVKKGGTEMGHEHHHHHHH